MEETKYYAFVMTMAEHMPCDTEAHRVLRARALEKLAIAVEAESKTRARCRDVDVAAAVRVRPWS